ncbi:MAG: hypothetical protein JXK07_12505 [Spirochaetes bacterium]|nr:hypothetical protein [Spirochaetota bacterium]MBN2771514.1 hypothetical protein [Spirochaetota bacterium]
MKNRLTLMVLSVIIMSVSLYTYQRLRYPSIESTQIEIHGKNAQLVFSKYSDYFKKDALLSEQYPVVIEHMLKNVPGLSLVCAIDSFGNIVHGERNKQAIPQKRAYNDIVNDLIKNRIANNQTFMLMHKKYYLYSVNCAPFTLHMVHGFELNRELLIQFITEAIIFSSLFTGFFIFLISRIAKVFSKAVKISVPSTAALKVFNNDNMVSDTEMQQKEESIDISETLESVNQSRVVPFETKESRKKQIRNFESYVFNTFNRIAITYKLNSISLYLLDNSSVSLRKIFELLGRAFVKTTANNSIENESCREIINALGDNSTIIRNGGRKILIPVFHEDELLGAVTINNRDTVTGTVVAKVKEELELLGSYLMSEILKNAG